MGKRIIHTPGQWKEYKQIQIVSTVSLRTLWSMADTVQEYYSGSPHHCAAWSDWWLHRRISWGCNAASKTDGKMTLRRQHWCCITNPRFSFQNMLNSPRSKKNGNCPQLKGFLFQSTVSIQNCICAKSTFVESRRYLQNNFTCLCFLYKSPSFVKTSSRFTF